MALSHSSFEFVHFAVLLQSWVAKSFLEAPDCRTGGFMDRKSLAADAMRRKLAQILVQTLGTLHR